MSAVGERAGLKQVLPECSCDAMIALYRAKGQYHGPDYSPQSGDIVFYDWDSSGTADHVGIIAESGGSLKVIEGNVSNRVDYRLISKGSPLIKGYAIAFPPEGEGAPTGADEGDTPGTAVGAGALDSPQKAPSDGTSGTTVGAAIGRPPSNEKASPSGGSSLPKGQTDEGNLIKLPTLFYGSSGNSVRAMQHLLIGSGHSCGSCGADGEFGAKTRDALIGFQKRTGLDPDAIAGKNTWTKLLL